MSKMCVFALRISDWILQWKGRLKLCYAGEKSPILRCQDLQHKEEGSLTNGCSSLCLLKGGEKGPSRFLCVF